MTTPLRAKTPIRGGARGVTKRYSARAVLGVLVIAAVVFLMTSPGFATITTLRALLLASAFVAMVAVGQAVLMISGNFLSMALGSQVAACALIFLTSLPLGLITATIFTILAGVLISAVQGLALGVFGANPIVLTIGASVIIEGAVILATNGATVTNRSAISLDFFSRPLGGIAIPVFAMVFVVILVQVYLRTTRIGVSSYLLGSNRSAARAAGLSGTAITISAFAVSGACCAMAGIMLGGFQGSGSLSLSGTLTFDSIAAVLVGGLSVTGGRGSAIAAALGAIGISAINSALLLRDFPTGTQILVKGIVVVIVVVIVRLLNPKERE